MGRDPRTSSILHSRPAATRCPIPGSLAVGNNHHTRSDYRSCPFARRTPMEDILWTRRRPYGSREHSRTCCRACHARPGRTRSGYSNPLRWRRRMVQDRAGVEAAATCNTARSRRCCRACHARSGRTRSGCSNPLRWRRRMVQDRAGAEAAATCSTARSRRCCRANRNRRGRTRSGCNSPRRWRRRMGQGWARPDTASSRPNRGDGLGPRPRSLSPCTSPRRPPRSRPAVNLPTIRGTNTGCSESDRCSRRSRIRTRLRDASSRRGLLPWLPRRPSGSSRSANRTWSVPDRNSIRCCHPSCRPGSWCSPGRCSPCSSEVGGRAPVRSVDRARARCTRH